MSGPEAGTLADRLAEAPLLGGVRQALGDEPGGDGPWLVGGAVRDALVGRPLGDIDIAVDGGAEQVARKLSAALGGRPFELSDEFETWRVGGPGGAWTVDIAALRAPTLESDLALRDFTVNAIALPLADELSRRDGIRFATILHDVGKPATRTERDGFVGFRGHDSVSYTHLSCRRIERCRSRWSPYH